MEKKRVFLVLLVFLASLVFLSVIASAEVNKTNNSSRTNSNSENDKISKGYQCLEDKIKSNERLSLQEAIFSTLALGNNQKAISVIEDDEGSDCWPRSSCKIKDTAQVMLAYQKIGRNTQDIENWLLSKNGSTPDLQWYLQIDIASHVQSECTISYSGRDNRVTIGQDMKITGNAGNCLSPSTSGYWLRINDNCISTEFTISCNQDFLTSLLYQRKNGDTVYVTSRTQSASSEGRTVEKVGAQCFRTGSSCDYEGSLWATYALSKEGVNIDQFIPYLLALSEDNTKFFPSALVYILTGNQDQYGNIIESQKQGKFWEVAASPYGRFYDTSSAMLALRNTNAVELTNAKGYLLEVQGTDGCWANGNIRDTAFVLYSGWSQIGGGNGGGSTPSPTGRTCSSKGGTSTCALRGACLEAGGIADTSYSCPEFNDICCSVAPVEQTCQQKGGSICSTNQQCSGSTVTSSSGSCCIGTCSAIPVEGTCESVYDGICRTSCDLDIEEEISSTCSDPGLACCVPTDTASDEETGSLWIWIIILIILIALVILGIIYRDKVRIWWYKFRGNAKTTKIDKPIYPPFGQAMPNRPSRFVSQRPPMTTRPMLPSRPVVSSRPPVSMNRPRSSPSGGPKDKGDMDETLKKLREMSE